MEITMSLDSILKLLSIESLKRFVTLFVLAVIIIIIN